MMTRSLVELTEMRSIGATSSTNFHLHVYPLSFVPPRPVSPVNHLVDLREKLGAPGFLPGPIGRMALLVEMNSRSGFVLCVIPVSFSCQFCCLVSELVSFRFETECEKKVCGAVDK